VQFFSALCSTERACSSSVLSMRGAVFAIDGPESNLGRME